MSDELEKLIARVKAMRGTSDEWLAGSLAVTRFIAALDDDEGRVLCRGEVRTNKAHWPAVLVYDDGDRKPYAWAPSGKDGAMQMHLVGLFHSGIPHAGIAREVLAEPETQTVRPI